MREEAVRGNLTLRHAEGHRGERPRRRQARDLRVERHVRVGLEVLLRQHRAVARHGNLQQHAGHRAERQRAGAALARGVHVDEDKRAHCQEHGAEHVPLQRRLLGALQPPDHQRGDEELRLQQHLVDTAAERRHREHLEEVAQGIDGANHAEDGEALRLPARAHTLHAVDGVRHQVHEQHREHLVHRDWRVPRVEDLAVRLGRVDQ
mmetsp:Transcript_108852/g.150549  ORF Transcript_108852/g.150549 Transcript_108852/m.150549 type:complete len:206 (+) Transcript_108852:322-939(+)